MQKSSYEKALQKAKIGLFIKKSVFITTVAMSLKYVTDSDIPTAAVDGKTMRINPEFFIGLSEEQRISLIAHESWHVAFTHVARVKLIADADRLRYNYAADYVINLMLHNAGYELGDNWLLDTAYADMNTEQVYNLLESQPPIDEFEPDIEVGEVDAKDIEDILIRASIQHRAEGQDIGDLPEEIKRTINQILNPVLPWNILLQNYMQDKVAIENSWSRPKRRYLPEFYLPSLHNEALTHIAIAIDTSASVTDEDLTAFLAEIQDIHISLHPEKLTVIDFDTKIKHVHTLTKEDSVNDISLIGGGGTNIHPVMQWANKEHPSVLVIFTDGKFREYPDKVHTDILWIIYQNPKYISKHGVVVHYD